MNRGWFYYTIPILLLVAALLQATVTTHLRLLGVKPDLVLLVVLIGTLLYGAAPGLAWAFWGGICLDIFSGSPMGASSIALLIATLVPGMIYDTLSRYNVLVPLGVAALGTLVYSLSYLGVLELITGLRTLTFLQTYNLPVLNLPLDATLRAIIIPAAFYNSVLMLLFTPLLNRRPVLSDL